MVLAGRAVLGPPSPGRAYVSVLKLLFVVWWHGWLSVYGGRGDSRCHYDSQIHTVRPTCRTLFGMKNTIPCSLRSSHSAPVLLIYLFAVGSVAAAVNYISGSQDANNIAPWLSAHYAIVFAGDVLLAGATAYFLLKTKKNVLPQTVGIINALVRLTFQTAMPAAVCVLINLALIYLKNPNIRSISNVFIQAMPKLYAVSMMWTLNARRRIRVAHGSSSLTGGTSNEPSRMDFSRSMTRRRVNVGEDIAMSGIQIVTHTESRFDEDIESIPTKADDLPLEEDTKSSSVYTKHV
ncbi:uncharacterized protein BT62DRAFT_63584 [Guyanagaster necrorhizus]|uniref:DUF6534 domain-containing protein n=1 Tax=Guyanagaster necrorhizus TaxID=856835 RepID=A0A9P7VVD3_9AGAR|nr:uncharacterized protein BT62DRAFT_63584 [Guyanagaster necrorhizus MCA 3950]KAG7447150.1 hypothetical protein BT62DRAFT_63584 [Guyanagaster necrorhizus MCA 3950]